ncbi:hypothetical protein MVEN_00353900 [Mycena venus]|uniref:Acyl-CoA thioesterase-like N-terminal HotDog domain-containing protein n=1 Tax=Mycena venus TaxID=2733690 RepID=A0A8H6YV20_9AGAR|nr:hypothetical protein MVEN_00353900 [Mycena venus]
MAPLGKAISVSYNGAPNADQKVYQGHVDPDWSGTRVPNGGYVLALAIEACIQHQACTPHRDPIHAAAHFLQPTSIAPFEVHVRTLRKGRGFTNVLADLVQQGRTRITTHLIFGILEPPRLVPPSSYARRLPLHVHPSVAIETPPRGWHFKKHIRWAHDPLLRAQNLQDSPARTNSTTVGGGGLVWGAWLELTGLNERITPASMAFLVDVFPNLPQNLPPSERLGVHPDQTWFATMTMCIEFKAPIPSCKE